jgi:K+-sensing histidine kinase KdpD
LDRWIGVSLTALHTRYPDHSHRIEGSRNPDTGGVGLGLSVTRSIIWEHGGDISLATCKGGGLSVRLELPAGPESNSLDQEKISLSGHAQELDLGNTNA